ncbi:hypothetical protein, partial [Thermogutta sp.]|uniref:hypothetical protein n=1 Tax=Thermogutta sp. TaxID=1962930 RepID=UPI00321FBC56
MEFAFHDGENTFHHSPLTIPALWEGFPHLFPKPPYVPVGLSPASRDNTLDPQDLSKEAMIPLTIKLGIGQ